MGKNLHGKYINAVGNIDTNLFSSRCGCGMGLYKIAFKNIFSTFHWLLKVKVRDIDKDLRKVA